MTKKQKIDLFRIIVSLVLTVVAVLIAPENYLGLCIFLIPYLVIGYDVVADAVMGIIHGQLLDEKFLMVAATAGAFAIGEYTEAVAVMLFFQVGELFEGIAVGKSRKNIMALMDIRPDRANVLRDGKETEVSPEEVAIDELIIIRPGERVPLDGIITKGETTVDTSALTGESMPQSLSVGDKIISGTVNISGVITVRVNCAFSESTVQRVLSLVENAAQKKAKSESFITRFARVYTPCVVACAVLLMLVPPLLFSEQWSTWIYRGLVFLTVSCPCALVVSVPLSFFAGIGRASKEGILIKGSAYMELLAKVKTVVLDKTGTLTEGRFTVKEIHPENVSEDELLYVAACAECNSRHPIARSIVEANKKELPTEIAEAREYTGKGVTALAEGKLLVAGNVDFVSEYAQVPDNAAEVGTSVVYVAADNKYLGYITLSDKIKSDSAQALLNLKKYGVEKTVMLTGDRKEIACRVAKELSIDEVRSELLPADKVSSIEELIPAYSPVAFVGDGINDAPVLTRSDIGIAMGCMGSDAAIEAADVVIMDDKLSKLPKAVRISRKTLSIVKQNIVIALCVKAAVLILGTVGIAGMWAAIFADVGVLVLAILNSMRAFTIKIE